MTKSIRDRRPLSKRARFAVLERDSFTCQYCGAKPPDGAVHVDHIIPRSEGGTDELDNLITSCEPCNSGKGRKPMKAPPLPDMEVLAEHIKAKREAIEKWRREHARYREVVPPAAAEIRSTYGLSIPQHMVEKAVTNYGPGEADYAASVTANKGIDRSDYEGQVAYFFAVLRNRNEEQAPKHEKPVPRPKCPYEFGNCWEKDGMSGDVDGCLVTLPDGSRSCCTPLVEDLGWDPVLYAASDFAAAWKAGGSDVLDCLLQQTNDLEALIIIGENFRRLADQLLDYANPTQRDDFEFYSRLWDLPDVVPPTNSLEAIFAKSKSFKREDTDAP